MATNKQQAYMDSCCFIEYVKHKVGIPLSTERDNEAWYIGQLLQASADRDIEIYTSTLTVAECTHAEGDISDEVQDWFIRLLTSGKHVILVEPDIFVAELARDLRWRHNIRLGGADGLHVASGIDRACVEFLTLEGEKKNNAILRNKGEIVKLGMTPRHPSDTTCLSEEYRQQVVPGVPPAPRKRKMGKKK